MSFIKSFIKEEDGIATIEIAIILAIGIALAVVFKDKIQKLWDDISGDLTAPTIDFKKS